MSKKKALEMRVLSRTECFELLESVPVGRVGTTSGALPVVLPVNFVLDGETVVFRTVTGTKLDAAVAGAVVAFECDGYDETGQFGWSVMLQGVASEVTEPDRLAKLRGLPLDPWALDGAAQRFVTIETTLVTGREFRRIDGQKHTPTA
jgi:nitroimidazol reductase NimA-like FMN-containing flavoprotein (pyridoxamine 5'-phosphate oxidase superfamily)